MSLRALFIHDIISGVFLTLIICIHLLKLKPFSSIEPYDKCPNGDAWYTKATFDDDPIEYGFGVWRSWIGRFLGIHWGQTSRSDLIISEVTVDPDDPALYKNDYSFEIGPDVVDSTWYEESGGQAEVNFCMRMALWDKRNLLTIRRVNFVQLAIAVTYDLVDEEFEVASFKTEVIEPEFVDVTDEYLCVADFCDDYGPRDGYEPLDLGGYNEFYPFKNGQEICLKVCPVDTEMTDVVSIDSLKMFREDPAGALYQQLIFNGFPVGGTVADVECEVDECCRVHFLLLGSFFPVPIYTDEGVIDDTYLETALVNGKGQCTLTMDQGRRQLRARTRTLQDPTSSSEFDTQFQVAASDEEAKGKGGSDMISATAGLVLGAAGALMI